jgi:polynucleotide 5'-kinase involved in rRNA processing
VLFNAACRWLSDEGRTELEIAKLLLKTDIASGDLPDVQERVRVSVNRLTKNPKLHKHAEAVEELEELERKSRSRWAEGQVPLCTLIGGSGSTKTGRD